MNRKQIEGLVRKALEEELNKANEDELEESEWETQIKPKDRWIPEEKEHLSEGKKRLNKELNKWATK